MNLEIDKEELCSNNPVNPIILEILIQTIRSFAKLRGRVKTYIFIYIIYITLKIYTC